MNSTRPAYSLIFAFLIMTVMLIVAGTAIQNTNDKLALYNELGGSSQAELAAESAAEQGIYAIADTDGDGVVDYSPGFEAQDNEAFCEDTDGDNSCNSWGDFIALAEQKSDGTYFYTPIFGTGTAGSSEECSVLDYIDPSDGSVLTGLPSDFVDDPCNWNKLMAGETVTIPLFDTDSSGNILLPSDLGLTSWSLKIRTPCSDDTMDSGCTRYVLDETDDSTTNFIDGDSVVFWQLLGENTRGDSVILLPDDLPARCRTRYCRSAPGSLNTEVYEGGINDASIPGDYVVLSTSSDPTSAYYDLYSTTTSTDLVDLYLQLNIVHTLQEVSTLNPIPYLEWQLQVDSSDPLADNKTVFIGQGYSNAKTNTYYSSHVISRSTTGENTNVYTLSN